MGLSIILTREGLPRLRKASNQTDAEIAIVGGSLSIHTIPVDAPWYCPTTLDMGGGRVMSDSQIADVLQAIMEAEAKASECDREWYRVKESLLTALGSMNIPERVFLERPAPGIEPEEVRGAD